MPAIWDIFPEEQREKEMVTRVLPDGICDVSKVREILVIRDAHYALDWEDYAAVQDFYRKYPDFRVGAPYECYTTFLLSDPPECLVRWTWDGTESREDVEVLPRGLGQFSHGCAALLRGMPTDVLILAEND